MSHKKWSVELGGSRKALCVYVTQLSVSSSPLMHLLSSHRLSPRHPSIHLPSQWLPLFPSTHYFLFILLMSQIQIWASLIEHTPLDTAALFEKTAISGCEELGKGNKSTVRLFSKAAGDCKMQKQRETCRLKKHAWMLLKRPALCCCLVSSLWLGASRACQGTTVESISVICSLSREEETADR